MKEGLWSSPLWNKGLSFLPSTIKCDSSDGPPADSPQEETLPKKMNICLSLSKGSSLIMQTSIEDTLGAKRFSGKEAKSSQMIIKS